MEIKLIQTGGLTGRTKIAEVDSDLSAAEFEQMLQTLSYEADENDRSRDHLLYFLTKNDKDEPTRIDISKIPLEWQDLFTELFRKLRVRPEL